MKRRETGPETNPEKKRSHKQEFKESADNLGRAFAIMYKILIFLAQILEIAGPAIPGGTLVGVALKTILQTNKVDAFKDATKKFLEENNPGQFSGEQIDIFFTNHFQEMAVQLGQFATESRSNQEKNYTKLTGLELGLADLAKMTVNQVAKDKELLKKVKRIDQELAAGNTKLDSLLAIAAEGNIKLDQIGSDVKNTYALMAQMAAQNQTKRREQQELSSSRRKENQLPLPNPLFLDPLEYLSKIDAQLSSNNSVVLHGLGGIGKTSLAAEYGHRWQANHSSGTVVWIGAESESSTASSLAEFIKRKLNSTNVSGSEDTRTLAIRAMDWLESLESNGNWLLIFDNAEDLKSIIEWIPRKGLGKIIITSRSQDWTRHTRSKIEISEWNLDAGVEFLCGNLRSEDFQSAMDLTDAMGGLPLALEQSRAYLEANPGLEIKDYLKEFRKKSKRKKLLSGGAPVDYVDTVATTWKISFDRIRELEAKTKELSATELLNLLALLTEYGFPEKGLDHTIGPKNKPGAIFSDKNQLHKSQELIRRYSLVQEGEYRTVRMHPLMREAVLGSLSKAEKVELYDQALAVLNSAFREYKLRNRNLNKNAEVQLAIWYSDSLLHSDSVSVLNWGAVNHISAPGEVELFNNAKQIFRFLGSPIEPAKRAQKSAQQYLGPKHPETIKNQILLAEAFRSQHQLQSAIEQLLLASKNVSEDNPELTLEISANLANVLRIDGVAGQLYDQKLIAAYGRVIITKENCEQIGQILIDFADRQLVQRQDARTALRYLEEGYKVYGRYGKNIDPTFALNYNLGKADILVAMNRTSEATQTLSAAKRAYEKQLDLLRVDKVNLNQPSIRVSEVNFLRLEGLIYVAEADDGSALRKFLPALELARALQLEREELHILNLAIRAQFELGLFVDIVAEFKKSLTNPAKYKRVSATYPSFLRYIYAGVVPAQINIPDLKGAEKSLGGYETLIKELDNQGIPAENDAAMIFVYRAIIKIKQKKWAETMEVSKAGLFFLQSSPELKQARPTQQDVFKNYLLLLTYLIIGLENSKTDDKTLEQIDPYMSIIQDNQEAFEKFPKEFEYFDYHWQLLYQKLNKR